MIAWRDIRHARSTAGLTAMAFILRMAWALAVHVPPAWDGVLYERAGRGIAAGFGYSCFMFGPLADPRVPTAYYPVGYPAYLALFYAVLGAAPWVVALAGALPSAGTVALVHRLALRMASPGAAAIAASALAVMPGQVIFASTPMTETLWGFLLTLAVWLLSRPPSPDRTPYRASIAWAAGALAAATYVRPQAALLAPVLLAIPVGRWRVRLTRAVLGTALVLAAVAPWTARNCLSLDGCAFVSTNGGSNLAIGAVPRSVGTYLALGPDDGCPGVVGEVARDRCWRAVALASVHRHPARWLRLGVTKIWHTVAYEAYPASYLRRAMPDRTDAAMEARLGGVLTVTWKALCLAALLALLPVYPHRPLGPPGVLCAAACACVIATHAVFFGGDRYHLPVAGLVAALASGALRGMPARWRAWRRHPNLSARPAA